MRRKSMASGGGGGGGWQIVVLLLVCTAIRVRSNASDHKYKVGDPVPLYANKVGPFHNPRSVFDFFFWPVFRVMISSSMR